MRHLIYQIRALCAEWLLETAFKVAPGGACKINIANALLDYAGAAKKETEA